MSSLRTRLIAGILVPAVVSVLWAQLAGPAAPGGAVEGPGGAGVSAGALLADNAPPVVALTSPVAGTTGAAFTPLVLSARATDADGTVARVQFLAGGVVLGEGVRTGATDFALTYSAGLAAGTRLLAARAEDNLGAVTDSAAVTLRLLPRLPYLADFEPAEGYTTGSLAGQFGWYVNAGAATVVVDATPSGARSVQLAGGTGTAIVGQQFVPVAGQNVVFVDFFARAFPTLSNAPNTRFDVEGARLSFHLVGNRGLLQVWAGDGLGGGAWQATNFTATLLGNAATTVWTRLSVRLDFAAKRWDAYADGRLVAADLRFASDAATGFTQFEARAYGAVPSWFDALLATTTNPIFTDADQDGLDDAWEIAQGLNPAVNDRAADPDGDGRSNVSEFLAGSGAQDFYNGVLPVLVSLVGPDQRPAADGAIAVRVQTGGGGVLANAPVIFDAGSGGLRLSTSAGLGSPSSQVSVRTDAQGIARVYVVFPVPAPPVGTVVARASSGALVQALTLPLVSPITDADGDGLHDPWELTQLGTLGYNAAQDPGGVGRSLLQSQQAALSPWPPPPVSSGLQVWFRSDLGLATGADNRVTRWTDLSGGGSHLAAPGVPAQPAAVPMAEGFGAKPAVRFDGVQTTLRSAPMDALKGSNDFTVFAVANVAASQAEYANILDYDHGTPPYGGFAIEQAALATNQYALGWRNVANDAWIGLGALLPVEAGGRRLLSYVKEGPVQAGYLDGGQKFSVAVPAAMGTNPPRALVLGSFGAGGRHFRGDLAEVLIYNRALTAAERAQVEAALTQRYTDSDGNGLPDTWEMRFFGRVGVEPAADADADGLSNRREFELGTSPVAADTDADGLPDGWEVEQGTRPLVADGIGDLDGDGLSNLLERILGTRADRAALNDASGSLQLRVYRPRS